MQKVAVLGHTSGIGKAIYKKFDRKNYQIIGLSRSNGYDIEESISHILDAIKDVDIFINNAYAKEKNIQLLFDLYEIWKDQKKIIINISSNSSDFRPSKPRQYPIWKGALDEASNQLSYLDNPCKVINIRHGDLSVAHC